MSVEKKRNSSVKEALNFLKKKSKYNHLVSESTSLTNPYLRP